MSEGNAKNGTPRKHRRRIFGLTGRRGDFRRLLAFAITVLAVGGMSPAYAASGAVGFGNGFRELNSGSAFDVQVFFDDRFNPDFVSGHMRHGTHDDGLAVDLSNFPTPSGTVTIVPFGPTELNTTIASTGSGTYHCGTKKVEVGGVLTDMDVCVVCQSFVNANGELSCVEIINDGVGSGTGPTCGAFSISTVDAATCGGWEMQLQSSFPDPHVGFSLGFDTGNIALPGAMNLMLCPQRSWQCDTTTPLTQSKVMGPEQSTQINTPQVFTFPWGSAF